MIKAVVTVNLKGEVSDPAGQAICGALNNMYPGFIKNVRVGKVLTLQLDETNLQKAEVELHKICDGILANPIMEEYSFEILAEEKDNG